MEIIKQTEKVMEQNGIPHLIPDVMENSSIVIISWQLCDMSVTIRFQIKTQKIIISCEKKIDSRILFSEDFDYCPETFIADVQNFFEILKSFQ